MYALFLVAAGLLAAGGVVVYRAQPVTAIVGEFTSEVVQVGQQLVRQSLNEDLKANFSPETETVVESLPEGKTSVSGWVDLVTEDGRVDRQIFSIVVFKNAGGEWAGEKLHVLPQR